ncbi:MAG: hypothetical protein EBU70_07310 [Actinobacteria bacterium]|nr:hypothetical protein [Actinomycetota bacterium]
MRRLILIDPCLADIGSHPYQCCVDLFAAAERAGLSCEAVSHRGFRPNASQWPRHRRLEPLLDSIGHSKYTAFGELDRLDGHGRARAILPIVRGVSPGDIVLLATASELDVAGLARAVREAGGPTGASWHAQFHYPLYRGFLEDFPRQERRLDRVRRLLTQAIREAAPHRLHLHVTTDELAAQYRRLGVSEVTVLPYPVRAVARGARTAGVTRIAALGDARPEKNSHLLADIVERAAADPRLAGRVTFAVQSNFGFPERSTAARDRAVRRSIERLRARRDAGVELLGGPLVAEPYVAELARADAMLLAYDQDRYRCRCSGVTLEAVASGIVPIVTGGGSMARLLADPIRRHAEAVVERGRADADASTPFSMDGRTVRAGRPWPIPIEPPAGDASVVARLTWRAVGDDAYHVPAAVVSLAVDGPGRPRRPGRRGRLRLSARGPCTTGAPRHSAGRVGGGRRPRVGVGDGGRGRAADPAVRRGHRGRSRRRPR